MIRSVLVHIGGVSVQTKIMGIVVWLTLVFGLGATYELRQRVAMTLGRELDERAVSIARDLAARSTDFILTNNIYGLYELTWDTVEHNRDVRYVLILGPDGSVLAHTFGAHLPVGLAEANAARPPDRHHLEILDTEEGLIRDVAVPIFEGRAGTARVGLTNRRLESEIERTTWELLLFTAGVALFGLGAAYCLLTLVVIRPIFELMGVVRQVQSGNLNARVRPRAHDEIGVLGQAFNAMTEGLEASRAETDEYNRRLLQRNRELAALNSMASAVSHSRTLRHVLDTALERSLQLTSLAAGWIWLLGDDHNSLRLGAHVGIEAIAQCPDRSRPLGTCACWIAVRAGEARFVEVGTVDCAVLRIEGLFGQLSIPLAAKGHTLGVMNLATPERREFSQEELDILAAVGSQIGVAIENARLWDELSRKEELRVQLLDRVIGAQEDERKRIARELHDETSQALTSLIVALKVIEEDHNPAATRHQAREAREIAAQTLSAIHDLARELRPSALDHFGLVPALQRYTREYAARHRLELDFQSIGLDEIRLPSQIETTLYRIAQEALTNVARHAQACCVAVLLKRRGDRVVMIVEDDGRGFDPAKIAGEVGEGTGLGIFGMRERVGLVGGTLTIESSGGGGTTVFVEVPLAEEVAV